MNCIWVELKKKGLRIERVKFLVIVLCVFGYDKE